MHSSAMLSRTGISALSKANEVNPRELLMKLIESNPNSPKDALFRMFRDEIADDDRFRRAVEWYFFVNMYEYALTSRHQKSTPFQRAETKAHTTQMVEQLKAQIVLLDLQMPNGRQMRECTGAEMAKFGSRFKTIADRVGKTKTVGEVLNEEQVRQIIDS